MKFSLKTTAVALIACTAFLSSCNTSLEVTKRQHRKGYHVSLNKQYKIQEQANNPIEAVAAETQTANEITVEVKKATFEPNTSRETLTNETVAFNSQKTELKEATTEFKKPSVLASIKAVKQAKKQLKKMKSNEGFKAADDSETMLLIYVLLAILLPPLAVFLFENQTITVNFWISLILSLLFWFPGIIFALLVIFGII